MPNPITFPLNERSYTINAAMNGLFGELGPAGGGSTGVWTVMWCPNISFDGNMAVMGRITSDDAVNDGAPLVQIPYVAIYLNGAVPGSPRSWSTDLISGTSLIEIPTGAMSPAFLFGVNSGYGRLYLINAEGGYTPL